MFKSSGSWLISLCISAAFTASAQAAVFENNFENKSAAQFNVENIAQAMQRFTRVAHPMASGEQKKLALEIKADLVKQGWDTQIQKFKTKIPNLAHDKLGGKDKNAAPVKEVEGENVIAVSKGSERCMLVIGGHYDTKIYKDIKFVGANDGGSSTAAMQELARVISQIRKQESAMKAAMPEAGRFVDCSIALAFFDGEEATLPEWSDGDHST